MKRLTSAVAALALLAGATVWLRAEDKKTTKDDVKALMMKVNKGEDSPMGKLGKELKAEEPSWEEVQKQVKELSELGRALGDCEATTKKAAGYQKGVEALDTATAKKDKTAAVEAQKMLFKSCSACHYGGAPRGTGGKP